MPKPQRHSNDHAFDGEDPIPVEWHNLTLLNGWTEIDGNYPPARFAFLPGRDSDGDPKIDLELAVTGGQSGSVIAKLKDSNGNAVTFAYDKPPFLVPDDAGGSWPISVKANGDIVDGIV